MSPSSYSRRELLSVVPAGLALGLTSGTLWAKSSGDTPPPPTQSAFAALCGNYRITRDHILGVGQFITDSGERILLFSDYQSGVIRRLFPVSDTEFVMGPGLAAQSPVEFKARFVVERNGKVAGMSLQPTNAAERFAERLAVKEQGVVITNGPVSLAGTLFTPPGPGPHPAIVLLHGSGPLTRYSFGPYPQFYTSLGLAVLTYDKRGSGDSSGALFDASTGALAELPSTYYPEDLLSDARAVLGFLRARKDIHAAKIGLWGSSEGGMLATQLGARSKDIAFVINSSGFMGPLWKTLVYQNEAILRSRGIPEADIERSKAFTQLWLNVAQTGRDYESYRKQRQIFLDEKQPWLMSWLSDSFTSLEQMRWDWDHLLAFDSVPALKNISCPTLGIFGELDILTHVAVSAKAMREALAGAGHKDATVTVIPNASHSLMEMPAGSRMAPGVFSTLRSWILERV